MNKLSVKLGILFFVIIFGLITFMFFFLHAEIVESRIEQELQTLKSREILTSPFLKSNSMMK